MLYKKTFTKNDYTLEYIFDVPANFDESKRYPIIFYMHGYGFVLNDFEYLIERAPLRRELIPEELQFILVIPKCNEQSWLFRFESICEFLKSIIDLPFVDDERVYLTGSSMGGYTCWLLLQAHSDWFTAATICCGGGQYWAGGLGVFNSIPIKAIHGALDPIVLPRESEIMANTINSAGGQVELIIHSDLAHNVWSRTFENQNLYHWFLMHKKKR